jgi:uncharacterized protein
LALKLKQILTRSFDSPSPREYHCAPMSNEPLPRRADLFKLAHQGAHLSSHVDVARLKRFAEALAGDSGVVAIDLQFGVDEQGVRFANGSLATDVKVLCQRCLQPMDWHVSSEVSIGLVRDDEQAGHLPKRYEPVIVTDDDEAELTDIIEDDLLLSLPLVTYHSQDECSGLSRYETEADVESPAPREEVVNPFSILEQLKKPRS